MKKRTDEVRFFVLASLLCLFESLIVDRKNSVLPLGRIFRLRSEHVDSSYD